MPTPAFAPLAPRVLGIVGLGVLVVLAGCGRSGKPAPVGGSDVPPSKVNLKRNVDLCRVEQRVQDYFVDTVGMIEAEGQTDLAAGVTGIVDEVLFREGDIVYPKGDKRCKPLILVDQNYYLAAKEVAEAALNGAESRLKLAQIQNTITQRAKEGSSQLEISKAAMDLRVADSDLQSAKANLRLVHHKFDRSQVRAPYLGYINQRKVTPGMYVEEKTVIATMADLSRLRLVGYVPEMAAPAVRAIIARQAAQRRAASLSTDGPATPPAAKGPPDPYDPLFTVLAYPERTFEKRPFRARIFYMSTVADPSTHMFECKAEVEGATREEPLQPGYTARIRFPLQSNPNACVVPEEAIRPTEQGWIAFEPVRRTGPDGESAWVAKQYPVEPGFRANGLVEIKQGLSPGQWIVQRGADALEEGTPLMIPEQQVQQLGR